MTKFKIQGVGLDTTTIKFNPGSFKGTESFGYIFTSIESNNDFIITDYINSLIGNPPLLTSIGFLDNIKPVINSHLNTLNRDHIDVLFLGNSSNFDYIQSVLELLDNKQVSHIGLDEPESLEYLVNKLEIAKKNNINIEYITLNICPLEFNLEIINYCTENNITIIGKNPFGGYLSAPRNIKMFSIPYLLGFSANYSDIVLVSGRDLIKALEYKDYLSNLIGTESSSVYILRKSTKKQVKELKKAIYTSIDVEGENFIVPYEDPELTIMPENFRPKIGSYTDSSIPDTNIKVVNEDISDFEEISNYLKIIYYPTDGNRFSKFAVARYKAIEYLNNLYRKEDGWRLEMVNFGSTLLLISAIKDPTISGYWFWRNLVPGETKQFYLILPLNELEGVLFKEVVLSEKEEEKAIERD